MIQLIQGGGGKLRLLFDAIDPYDKGPASTVKRPTIPLSLTYSHALLICSMTLPFRKIVHSVTFLMARFTMHPEARNHFQVVAKKIIKKRLKIERVCTKSN